MPTKLTPRGIPATFFDQQAGTTCAWLGMAGLIVNARGTIMMIDPLITVVERDGIRRSETDLPLLIPFLPLEEKSVPRVDVVMYTHAGDDHFGRLTPQALDRRLAPVFLAPPPVLARLREMGVAGSRLMPARDFESSAIGNAKVEITPALHDHNPVNPWKRGDCCGFIIRTPDGAIWHPGDTRLIPELLEFRGVDVLLWDVAYQVHTHLGPDGSAALARTCGAKVYLAYHYGTFEAPEDGGYRRALQSEPDDSLPFAAGLPGEFRVVEPGEVVALPLAV
ncbi:MAG: MBL fold metallo-hydrolase [Phycisphaerae bacterium]